MKLGASLLCAAVLAAAGAAQARQGIDADAPIDITADELEVLNNPCLMIWKGGAEALQGPARLRADTLRAFAEVKAGAKPAAASGGAPGGGNCGATERLEAVGNVYYVTGDRRVRGDSGVYDVAAETITITGDVVAAQGQNVLRGRKMVVNTRTGEARMQSDVTGRNKPGRVRGVFYPASRQQP
ncbi:MAG: organic solvent tolerance protein OstA [Caulobacteraceae bacterium]|nr:organic solvent tolerance protein OstA [Caulobacteraceae bacterium]